jgi:hypothetical protein
LFEGVGTFVAPNGDSFKGTWHAGLPHGHGRFIDAKTKHRFEGEFVNGRRVGTFNEYDEAGAFVQHVVFNDNNLFDSEDLEMDEDLEDEAFDEDFEADPEEDAEASDGEAGTVD